jgi:hypothetical protein
VRISGAIVNRCLTWLTDGVTVLGPAPFSGVALRKRFLDWCEANLGCRSRRSSTDAAPCRKDLTGCGRMISKRAPMPRRATSGPAFATTAQPQRIVIATAQPAAACATIPTRPWGLHQDSSTVGSMTATAADVKALLDRYCAP